MQIEIQSTGETMAQHAFFERHPTIAFAQPLTDAVLEPFGARLVVPEVVPEPVPQQCTRRQGLLALLSYGFKRADIEAQIETIEDETEREAAWIEYLADTWDIGNPRLQGMWAALGGTQQQLPDLFRLAVTL